jgi:toxin ParE1/3/4
VTSGIVWSRRARYDLGQALDFIRKRSPSGAATIQNLVQSSVEKLAAYPHLHREGRVPGTREAVVHPNYLYVYVVREDVIIILRVLHARQQYPPA